MKKNSLPISLAKQISKEREFSEIIIIGYNAETGMKVVTTYGRTTDDSIDAARTGNKIKKMLGFPDEMCHSKPYKQKESF